MLDFLRPKNVICTYCQATDKEGVARTLSAVAGSLTVTWHTAACPHYAADLILAAGAAAGPGENRQP
ncbi:hypothetical protein [Streptomyces sp. NPDC006463]|uniref:hypothetical protein n=1 Tax=Streptomyces sp. NPDC006463 TaxID=3364746 RepID=UPI0036BDB3C5